MRIWMIIFFLGLGITVNAQEVISKGQVYQIKGKSIFQDGTDITSTLQTDERDHIFTTLKNDTKNAKDAEKARKKLEKSAKDAEQAQKKAEKALKQKQKAQNNFNSANKKLNQNQDKYEKLKNQGRLSPNDEAKWLKKLAGYKKDLEKTRKKL